jgi:hypothetical protein
MTTGRIDQVASNNEGTPKTCYSQGMPAAMGNRNLHSLRHASKHNPPTKQQE